MHQASSDLLPVGSLPTGSAEAAVRDGSELFSDLLFALPDGESGPARRLVPVALRVDQLRVDQLEYPTDDA